MTLKFGALRRGALVASLALLAGCATPYPTRYAQTPIGGGAAAAGLSTACSDAIGDPSSQLNVKNCLVGRAAGWESRATTARRVSRGAGVFAIPAAAVAIALAAEGDPNHAILPLGVASGAAVTYAGAYARPEQAEASEKAVAAYNCLLSAVAEWQAGSNLKSIEAALAALRRDIGVARTEFAGASLSQLSDPAALESLRRGHAVAVQQAIDAQKGASVANANRLELVKTAIENEGARFTRAARAIQASRGSLDVAETTAEAAYQKVKGDAGLPGARLLKQSDEVDRLAIAEIAKRELSPLAVASNARQSILSVSSAVKSAIPAPPPATPSGDRAGFRGVAEDPCAGKIGPKTTIACRNLRTWAQLADAAEDQARVAAALTARIQGDAAVFDAAVRANKAADPTLGQNCTVAVTEIPILTASPASVTLAGGKGQFTLSGGIGHYVFDTPPDGWSVVMASADKTSVRVDISGPAAGASEAKQDLTFRDGSGSGTVTVEVTVPAAPAT